MRSTVDVLETASTLWCHVATVPRAAGFDVAEAMLTFLAIHDTRLHCLLASDPQVSAMDAGYGPKGSSLQQLSGGKVIVTDRASYRATFLRGGAMVMAWTSAASVCTHNARGWRNA